MIDLLDKQSQAFLNSIEEGESIFQHVPTDLGQLVFCGTTNEKAAPNDAAKTKKQMIQTIAFIVIGIAATWAIFHNSPVFSSILTLIILFIGYKISKKVRNFKGEDFFIGKDGFEIVAFEDNRGNIVSSAKVLFSEVSDMITEQVHVKQNGVYQHTEYFITFVSDKKEQIVYSYAGSYDKKDPDLLRVFFDNVIGMWESYLAPRLGVIPMSFNAFKLSDKGEIETVWFPYIEVFEDHMTIHKKDYFYEEIKSMRFDGGCLVIEHKNHTVKTKLLFFKKESGDIERIPIGAVSNHKFFILYFGLLMRKLGYSTDSSN